jgi:hypothetical protein
MESIYGHTGRTEQATINKFCWGHPQFRRRV